MELQEMVEAFKKMSFEQQRVMFEKFAPFVKRLPCSITFSLDPEGMKRMARVLAYCKKHDIFYKPEKVSVTKVKFTFNNMDVRNNVLVGSMTV
jgi:hypothetical protein